MPEATLSTILEEHRSQPHQLIEALQDVQHHAGYISEDAMRAVSTELGVPLMEVYSAASFYKAFSLTPRGENVITICTGTACHVRGANLILSQATSQLGVDPSEMTADGLFTVERVNCIGACALAPVVTENGNTHHHMKPGKLRKLIKSIQTADKEDGSHD
jgi:NADH:ubiquinone oxidoreductase subunit E